MRLLESRDHCQLSNLLDDYNGECLFEDLGLYCDRTVAATNLLANDRIFTLAAFDQDHSIKGAMACFVDHPWYSLDVLSIMLFWYVRPGHRNGLGRLILEGAMTVSKNMGASHFSFGKCYAHIKNDRNAMDRLAERMGFAVCGVEYMRTL